MTTRIYLERPLHEHNPQSSLIFELLININEAREGLKQIKGVTASIIFASLT